MKKLVRASTFLLVAVSLLLPWGSIAVAQNETVVQNLRAFAKLYGYVKYFHPSDEATLIDWNAFAVYGVSKIKDAKNPDELLAKLDNLFAPIAPTLHLAQTKEELLEHKTETSNPADDLLLTAWQHLGGGLDDTLGSCYKSKRLNFN